MKLSYEEYYVYVYCIAVNQEPRRHGNVAVEACTHQQLTTERVRQKSVFVLTVKSIAIDNWSCKTTRNLQYR
jgi:hypothetical protein